MIDSALAQNHVERCAQQVPMFRMEDGSIVAIPKDCGCLSHLGPHWLHADAEWRLRNGLLRELACDETIEKDRRYYAGIGFAKEESARLAQKLAFMRHYRITAILNSHHAEKIC